MALSHIPASVANAFGHIAHWLDRRSAARVPLLMLGMLLASGRRTVTSWFRAAGVTVEFRKGYVTVCAVGRAFEDAAISTALAVKPLLPREATAARHRRHSYFAVRPPGRGLRHPS